MVSRPQAIEKYFQIDCRELFFHGPKQVHHLFNHIDITFRQRLLEHQIAQYAKLVRKKHERRIGIRQMLDDFMAIGILGVVQRRQQAHPNFWPGRIRPIDNQRPLSHRHRRCHLIETGQQAGQ